MIGIYKITSPSGRIYIGQSINIDRRKRYYKILKCKNQPKIYRSLKKYGWDKHKFEVIHQCTKEELNDLEVYYIELYQCFNSEFGLNLQSGGTARLHTEETKEKIRKANIGRKMTDEQKKKLKAAWDIRKTIPISEETRKKLSEAQKGRKATEETLKKLREFQQRRCSSDEYRLSLIGSKNPFFGKKHTEEFKHRLSEIAKNRPKEHYKNIIQKCSIKVNQYTLDGVFIKEWFSAKEAGRELGIDNGDIGKVCMGKRRQVKGFIFKYTNKR